MKKSDHSKLANNSFLTFQGTTALFALQRGVFCTKWLLHAKGPLNSLPPALECMQCSTNRSAESARVAYVSRVYKNRGKDWDSNVELIPRETKLVSQSKWKLLKFDKYVFLANCSIAPLPTFSENAALYIISRRPGAKGHEEGMFTCTYVYIRIPNVHFLII